jgi:hypothetical protein
MTRLITIFFVLLITSPTVSLYSKDDFDKMGIASERRAHPKHPGKKIKKRYIENNQKKRKVKTYRKIITDSDCNVYVVYKSEGQKKINKNLKRNHSKY